MLALLASTALSTTPVGWVRHSVVANPSDTTVDFSVCLKQRNLNRLFDAALEVSTPKHPRYGQYWTASEIEELTAPTPEHVRTVSAWLDEHGVGYTREKECLRVSTSVDAASRLLSTTFGNYHREVDGRRKVRADGEPTLPARVEAAVDAIFGLHGVPLPPRTPLLSSSSKGPNPMPKEPAKVTPTVLAKTYHVVNPYVDRDGKNKQAVAEFQGQYMDKADLELFFSTEKPPGAEEGDEKVHKFVGVPYKKGTGVEADLDIQFIMGVAPGVKTEFWEWPDQDFCGDLLNYTGTLLQPGGPITNSISYGWQGDLSQVGCKDALVGKVDANWAKLALAGISMMISSGDSGSQCTSNACQPKSWKKDMAVNDGEVLKVTNTRAASCCEEAESRDAAAFTWTPPPMQEVAAVASKASLVEEAVTSGDVVDFKATPYKFDKAPFHVELSFLDDVFPQRDIHILDGSIGAGEGHVKLHNANGTFDDTTIKFGPAPSKPSPVSERNITAKIMKTTYTGRATFIKLGSELQCLELNWDKPEGKGFHSNDLGAILSHGPNPPPPPPEGNCTIYKTSSGSLTPSTGALSGGPKIIKSSYVLYPSWPASSPWVTAVGATRFVNQTIGMAEMATDQFGSGGGFSTMWNQSHASWQVDAVAKYVAMGYSAPLKKFPPKGTFPPHGRATPDVSALGEGYQVYTGGHVQSVGGTSASSPCFAGYVSLLNEARFKAGKPRMGFLNPFLYANPDAFTDCTLGTNAIGRGQGLDLKYGFAAAPGWDAATGLGTPLVDKLLEAALAA